MRKQLKLPLRAWTFAAAFCVARFAMADAGFTDFSKLTGTASPVTNLPAKATVTKPRKDTQLAGTRAPAAQVAATSVATTTSAGNEPAGTQPGANQTPALNGYIPDDKYKLRVGDRVSFQILEDRDVPKPLLIADSGELDVPYVGRISAIDKTCKQLRDELKAQLEKEYYFRATVVLALDAANKVLGRIYVWGQVRNQGPLEIGVNENLTVGKAILRAGGFADFANKKHVKLIRAANAADQKGKQTFELNMIEILEEGKTEKDLLLQPDDSIIVQSRAFNF